MILKKLPVFIAVFLCAAALVAAPISTPDTPAGHTLQAWLSAFNSGDRSQLDNYVKTIDPRQSADGMLAFRGQTGGFDLLSSESVDSLHVRFKVKEKNSSTVGIGTLAVKDGTPPTVETFSLRAIPPGATPVDVVVDTEMR